MKSNNKLPPWLRPKTPPRTSQVFVAWYTAEEWQAVKAFATDSERFEATFPEWEAMAEEAIAEMRAVGVNVGKFDVVAQQLQAWCLVTNKANNAASRAEFVSLQGSKAVAEGL